MNKITINEYELELSNLDKVFFRKADVTKGEVIEYYMKIFSTMKSHLNNRPLTLHRYPDGIDGEEFYQKEAPDYLPTYVSTLKIDKKEGGSQQQMICDKKATIVYLVNLGTIIFHIWLSQVDSLNNPDKIVFDLDPPGDDFEVVRDAAFDLRTYLKGLGLGSFVMTTGSKGLHVALPIKKELVFDEVRKLSGIIASRLAADYPKKYTTEIRKNQREGRLFLDNARNAYGQTSVAPYSLRARASCSVATPIDWDELRDSSLHSQSYTIKNIFRRLGQKKDPWKNFYDEPISLKSHMEELMEMQ